MPSAEPLDLCARAGLLTARQCEAGARFRRLYRAVRSPKGPALPAWYGRAAGDEPDPGHLVELARELREAMEAISPSDAEAVTDVCARREWPRARDGLARLREGSAALADLWRIEERTPAARWADASPAAQRHGRA